MTAKVLITGASRGIGKAVALQLQNRFSLILHASSEESLSSLRGELADNNRHQSLCADFSDAMQLREFCAQLKKSHTSGLFAVINNAGVTLDKSLLFQPEGDIDKIFQVNLKAPILISKTAFKIFHAVGKGVIINIGSCVGESGNAFQCVYAAAKAGLTAFSKSLAREAGALNPHHQIRVLSIAPGFIDTDMTAKLPETEKQKYLAAIPSRRLGKVGDVASLVDFLLSDTAGYINGSEIKINGGIL